MECCRPSKTARALLTWILGVWTWKKKVLKCQRTPIIIWLLPVLTSNIFDWGKKFMNFVWFTIVIIICISNTINWAVQLTNEQLIELAKGFQKLIQVEIHFNSTITDKGITEGLFAHCPCIERVVLYSCMRIKDNFFTNLPATLKRLQIEIGRVIFVINVLFISYTPVTYILL